MLIEAITLWKAAGSRLRLITRLSALAKYGLAWSGAALPWGGPWSGKQAALPKWSRIRRRGLDEDES
jgi:hypothetical protein